MELGTRGDRQARLFLATFGEQSVVHARFPRTNNPPGMYGGRGRKEPKSSGWKRRARTHTHTHTHTHAHTHTHTLAITSKDLPQQGASAERFRNGRDVVVLISRGRPRVGRRNGRPRYALVCILCWIRRRQDGCGSFGHCVIFTSCPTAQAAGRHSFFLFLFSYFAVLARVLWPMKCAVMTSSPHYCSLEVAFVNGWLNWSGPRKAS